MGDTELTRDELEVRQDEIRSRVQEVEQQFGDQPYTDEVRNEITELETEYDRNDAHLCELDQRKERLRKIVDSRGGVSGAGVEAGATFGTPYVTRQPDNIYDLSTIRMSLANPEQVTKELRDRAMRAIESAKFGEARNRERYQDRAASLVEHADDDNGWLARRVLVTGNPVYQRAFGKHLAGKPLSSEESRALSSGTGSEGGYAVPFTLDPSVILTSDGSVNPLRQIARVESITTNEWRGVSSAGITASYVAEGDEAGDDSPSLDQPTVVPERAHAFVPFSFEIGADWGGLRSEMTRMLQEAKDDLEADKFVNGSGSGEPEGIIAGLDAGSEVNTSADNEIATEDIYALDDALGPRYRARAQFIANKAVYNYVRQLSDNDGPDLWVRLGQGLPPELIGYSAREASAMDNADLATGDKPLLLGDFRHYLIVDRVGMDVELVPHLFGSNNRPKGQRGLYAFWRNSAVILVDEAFRVLNVTGT